MGNVIEVVGLVMIVVLVGLAGWVLKIYVIDPWRRVSGKSRDEEADFERGVLGAIDGTGGEAGGAVAIAEVSEEGRVSSADGASGEAADGIATVLNRLEGTGIVCGGEGRVDIGGEGVRAEAVRLRDGRLGVVTSAAHDIETLARMIRRFDVVFIPVEDGRAIAGQELTDFISENI